MVLRIGLLISELFVGGAEKNLVRLACGLNQRGHQVHVYSLDRRPPPGKDILVHALEAANVPIVFLNHSGSSLDNVRRLWRPDQRLRSQISRDQIQVVGSMLFRANWHAVAALGQQVPVAIGLRVSEARTWVRRLEDYCVRHCDAVISVSTSVATGYQTATRAKRSEIIPNSVDADADAIDADAEVSFADSNHLSEEQAGTSERRSSLLYVGRLTPQKNLPRLLRLANRALEQLPNHCLELLGDGVERKKLETLAASLTCASRIHFLGWQPDAIHRIRRSDVLLLTSDYEGMPNAILEAMSVGKPFVAFETDGLPDIFFPLPPSRMEPGTEQQAERNYHLQVKAKDDENGFAEQAIRFARNTGGENAVGAWNQRWVQLHFGLETFLDRYEQLFQSLVAG